MKYSKHILALFIIINILTGCNSQPVNKTLITQTFKQVSYYYPPSFMDTKMVENTYFEHNAETFFALLDFPKDDANSPIKLSIYNLSLPNPLFIVDLPQDLKRRKGVAMMEVIGWDSLLVEFYEDAPPLFLRDSTIYLIDFKGKVKRMMNLEGLPISTLKHPRNEQKTEEIYFYGSQSMSYYDGKIVIPFKRTDIGRTTAKNFRMPVAGVFDLKTDIFIPFEDFGYPSSEFLGQEWASGYEYPRIAMSLENKPLISWGHEPTIWEYDTGSKKCRKIELSPSSMLKPIHPLELDRNGMPTHQDDFEPDAGGYLYLLSDPYRKQYLRVTSLPPLFYGNSELVISDTKKSVILYDSDFNKLGEGVTGLHLSTKPLHVIREGYIQMDFEKIMGNLKSGKIVTDSIFLKIVNFVPSDTPSNNEILKNQQQNQDIVSYLKKYHTQILKSKKSIVVTSYIENTCKGCLKQILEEIGNKKNQKEYPNVYLLLIFEREMQPQDYLAATDLNNPNIFSEKEGKHQTYFHQSFNPKAYFFKNGKLVENTQIMPANEQEVIERIRKYMK